MPHDRNVLTVGNLKIYVAQSGDVFRPDGVDFAKIFEFNQRGGNHLCIVSLFPRNRSVWCFLL